MRIDTFRLLHINSKGSDYFARKSLATFEARASGVTSFSLRASIASCEASTLLCKLLSLACKSVRRTSSRAKSACTIRPPWFILEKIFALLESLDRGCMLDYHCYVPRQWQLCKSMWELQEFTIFMHAQHNVLHKGLWQISSVREFERHKPSKIDRVSPCSQSKINCQFSTCQIAELSWHRATEAAIWLAVKREKTISLSMLGHPHLFAVSHLLCYCLHLCSLHSYSLGWLQTFFARAPVHELYAPFV